VRAPLPVSALAGLLLLGAFHAPAATAPQRGGDSKVGSGKEKLQPFKVGYKIEEFTFSLPDIDGALHTWEGLEDHTLVLIFWSMRDPLTRGYEERVAQLMDKFQRHDVSFFFIQSNNDEVPWHLDDPFANHRKYLEDRELDYPILFDRGNKVADRFGALTSNHAFVINKKRYLRYAGGIDSDPKGQRKGEQAATVARWLEDAIEAIRKGGVPDQPITRPTGRKIKRVRKTG
jgi:peroxiredoxin